MLSGRLFAEDAASSDSESSSAEVDDDSKATGCEAVSFRCAPRRQLPAVDASDEIFVLDTKASAAEEAVGEGGADSSEWTLADARPQSVDKLLKGKREAPKKGLLAGGPHGNAIDSTQKLLSKSVVQPGFEKRIAEGSTSKSRRQLKRLRKVERERTKGSDWYNLPATELTDDIQHDLEVIQMRNALDTKTHYKKNDRSVLPKYFQVGTVIETKAEFYSSRIPKKQRKRTIVEELMADVEFQSKQKKKYEEIKRFQMTKRKGAFQHSSYPKKRRNRQKHS